MLLATMNSSEKAQYMWETYGKEEENDGEDIITDGHYNGKEWQNEEAENAAYEEAQKVPKPNMTGRLPSQVKTQPKVLLPQKLLPLEGNVNESQA